MANQLLARLGIVLAVDSAELETGLTAAKAKFTGFSKEVQRQSNEAAKMTMALKYATESYGKSLTALERVELEMRVGKLAGQKMSDIQIKLLKDTAKAYDEAVAAAKRADAAMSKSKGLRPDLQAALGYQATDVITGLAGGQNPLMVLLQQGGQLRDQFGGFKPMFQGIASALTPVRLAVAGVGGAVLAFAYALYQGREEQKAFNAAMATTNSYAGVTYANIISASEALSSKYHVSLKGVRAAMQDLVASGQFTSVSINSVADTIAKIAKVSNTSADEVAKNLIPSLDGSASSAKRLNDQYHFLTVSQYKHIQQLNEQGQKQQAIKYTTDLLNASIKDQSTELKGLPKQWDDLTSSLGRYWQRLKDLSGDETPEIAAARLKNRIAYLQTGDQSYGPNQAALEGAQEQYRLLQKQMTVTAELKAKKEQEDAERERKLADEVEGRNAKRRQKENQAEDFDIAARASAAILANDKISEIEEKRVKDMLTAIRNTRRLDADENFTYTKENAKTLQSQLTAINAAADRETRDIRAKAAEQYRVAAQTEEDAVDKERERIAFYKEHVFLQGSELEIALTRLKTEQEIAAIYAKKDGGSDEEKAKAAADLRRIQVKREANIQEAEQLKMLQDMNSSVFNNMGSAIDTFVRTGKFAFKDFARSVIQDLIAISMKAQMLAMFKGFTFFGGSTTGQFEKDINTSGFGTLTASAVGGPLAANQPSIVGENGPELFVPQGAGTIVPNNGDLSGVMGGPQIVYNGPYIANMSAIDTQSATQFLAKNKSAVYAANQSATRSIPASR